jgi:glycosyltransferase involved in cell wall biosynthesis
LNPGHEKPPSPPDFDKVKAVRALHVIPSLSLKHGGPSVALPALARALRSQNISVTVATTDDDGPSKRLDVPLTKPLTTADGVRYFYFRKNIDFYKFSWSLTRWLEKHVQEFDLLHIHALFSYASTGAAVVAKHKGIPYIIRPLGVLNEWGMRNRRHVMKMASVRLIESRILRNATAIQYTTERERREAATSVPIVKDVRSAVISLPVETKQVSGERFFEKFPTAKGKNIILFLSRIHQKKGLELLLEAFRRVRWNNPFAILVIAGDGAAEYVSILKRRAHDMHLEDDVVWAGFLEGDDKQAAFAAATVFVLPSFSENFGIAAAEALASGVPVVLTEQVGLSEEVQAAEAGVIVNSTSEAIAKAVAELLRDPSKRQRLAANGRQLASGRFSLQSVGSALAGLYTETINDAKRAR